MLQPIFRRTPRGVRELKCFSAVMWEGFQTGRTPRGVRELK